MNRVDAYSELDGVVEMSRRRINELDNEYDEETAAINAEIAERDEEDRRQQEEFEREQAERREAERAVERERAREEHIRIGQEDDEDPFVNRPGGGAFSGVGGSREAESTPTPQAQPSSPSPAGWNVRAGRFGQAEPEPEQPVKAEKPERSEDVQPATPPPRPAPRRHISLGDDWDDDDDFSQRSWLR